MGYTRRFNRTYTVTGTAHGTMSYPASQNGGSKSVSVNYSVDVPITVDCHVDTSPFEHSVTRCNTQIDILTGTVVATQTAEVQAKKASSKKVGKHLIEGFFGYIRSEITQQISELSAKVKAHIGHLVEMAKTCRSKQEVMQRDFAQIKSRYGNTFSELDKELRNRVLELDKPAFQFVKEAMWEINRPAKDMLLNTVTVGNLEMTGLESVLCSSGMKQKTLALLYDGRRFLQQNRKLKTSIETMLVDEECSHTIYVPVLYTQSSDNNQGKVSRLFCPPLSVMKENAGKISQSIETGCQNWTAMTKESRTRVEGYLKREISQAMPDGNTHAERVAGMIFKMWSEAPLQVLAGN